MGYKSNLDNLIEQRMAIKFCFKQDYRKIRSKCYHKSYGKLCLKKTAVYEWFGRFQDDQESVVDVDRSGRYTTTQTDENISHVAALLKENRIVTCRLAAEKLNISKSIIQRLLKRITCVRPEKFRDREFFILQNNAQNVAINQQFLVDKWVPTIHYPPYLLDISPPDYLAFPKLILKLKGDRFESIEDIQKAVTDKLKIILVKAFQKAMEDLKTRSLRCIEVEENYFEKCMR